MSPSRCNSGAFRDDTEGRVKHACIQTQASPNKPNTQYSGAMNPNIPSTQYSGDVSPNRPSAQYSEKGASLCAPQFPQEQGRHELPHETVVKIRAIVVEGD